MNEIDESISEASRQLTAPLRKTAQTAFEVLALRAENAELRTAVASAQEVIEEMNRIHHDIMDNGPQCTCGDGDEWCVRCGKSIRLSDRAYAALERLDAVLGLKEP